MSHHNPLTVKRHQKVLADMIVDVMQNDYLSLLEAYVKVQGMVTSDEVINLAKEKIAKLNGVKVEEL